MKLVPFALVILFYSLSSFASGYPPNYCDQTVRLIHQGPAIFAHIDSGCIAGDVIGYKNSGVLARNNPEFIDAVITGHCGVLQKTKVVRLGREYNGRGYLNDGKFTIQSFSYELDCPEVTLEIAFNSGQQWDSDYGRNYRLGIQDFYGPRVRSYATKQGSPYGAINLAAWDFIVNEL